MFGPAVMLLAMCFTGCHSTIAVSIISATLGLSGFASAGFNVNHIDIAPNYAGTLMGITNMCANSMGIITPYFVGFIINGHVSAYVLVNENLCLFMLSRKVGQGKTLSLFENKPAIIRLIHANYA